MEKKFKKVLLLGHYTLNDPTTVNTIRSMAAVSAKVLVLQQSRASSSLLAACTNVQVINLYDFRHFKAIKGLVSILRWWYYNIRLKWTCLVYSPELIVSFMLYPLAALAPSSRKKYRLLCCIYDLPSIKNAGRMDSLIHKKAWSLLKFADLVWASDPYKAALTKEFGGLSQLPLICYNCPNDAVISYVPGKRSLWLRGELEKQGAPIRENKGCIMLRAGAIGDLGGIEETMEVMLHLPEDFVFLLMGRSSEAYKNKLLDQIRNLGLSRRVILWDRPDDERWRKAIEGADIGHLLHLVPTDPAPKEMYQLNSSLSNNRLFNYMAAGLPIVSYNDPRMEEIHKEIACFEVVDCSHIRQSLSHALNKLFQDKPGREMKGYAAYQAFLTKYNWNVQFAPVLEKLDNL